MGISTFWDTPPFREFYHIRQLSLARANWQTQLDHILQYVGQWLDKLLIISYFVGVYFHLVGEVVFIQLGQCVSHSLLGHV